MWSPLSLLRRKISEVVMLGVNDGLEAVFSDENTPASLADLRTAIAGKVSKALPPAPLPAPEDAPDDTEKAKSRKGSK